MSDGYGIRLWCKENSRNAFECLSTNIKLDMEGTMDGYETKSKRSEICT